MQNLTQHLSHQPTFLLVFVLALLLVVTSIPYFYEQQKRYGSLLDFASPSRRTIAGLSFIALVGMIFYGFTPYVAPPTDELAIVLGNTQNTPAPKITKDISDAIEGTLMQHKGDDVSTLADSIKIISAVKHPDVISLDPSELHLKEIGKNSSNAKRSAETDIKAIEGKINSLSPTDNGANYLEAILEARDNVKEGSKIIVIGSGLSDNGDLNFSKSNILTSEQGRNDAIRNIKNKYGTDALDTYNIEFYGLGDTVGPQVPLSNKQKELVRSTYKNSIRGLGGNASVGTKTLTGMPVKTNYIVGATDTGCGDIGLVFDDDNLKFVSNEAVFTNQSAAKSSLSTIKNLWDRYSDNIQSIQVDGYIAHYAGPDNLSLQRANLVKQVLINLGVPANKISTAGRGFGPYQQDTQNRIVKITISRNGDQCEN